MVTVNPGVASTYFVKYNDYNRKLILNEVSFTDANVDIANEFVALMTGQRNFAANAKTLTTADQMLQEVLNIKSELVP